jgi:hypothetical protein
MNNRIEIINKKMLEEDRIAICPQIGCNFIKRVKPLKFGFFGSRKYPKCSKHKTPLVFAEEFVGNFIRAVNACLFDISSLPPRDLVILIKKKAPEDLLAFINGWMYCNPIGRGAQIVSRYLDGLSRGYIKILSRKQRKAFKSEKSSKKRYGMLRLGLKKIADEYTIFLRELNEKSELLCDQRNLCLLSNKLQHVLKIWLIDNLKLIKEANDIRINKSSIQNKSLTLIKEEYDKVLHTGTCALLLGKNPSIVTKAIPAFELFSAYYEFLKADLCTELKREDIELLLKESQEFLYFDVENILNTQEDEKKDFFNESGNMKDKNYDYEKKCEKVVKVFNINVPNLRKEIKNHLETILIALNNTQKQKNIIWSKSIKILDEFISRAEDGKFTIYTNTDPNSIASSIIYAVSVSNEDIPNISLNKLSKISGIYYSTINYYYNHYFRLVFPKLEFSFSHRLKIIKNIFALYIFEIIIKSSLETNEFVSLFRNNINNNTNLPKQLTEKDIDLLKSIMNKYPDNFDKYFSDLIDIVKLISIQSFNLKKISGHFIIKSFCDYLNKHDIDLFYSQSTLPHVITNIFDYLKKHTDLLPDRAKQTITNSKKYPIQSNEDYRTILGNRIKFYIIKNIYNGRYLINGKCHCLECLEEGFTKNTTEIRLSSLEFHHYKDSKEQEYSTSKLARIFESKGFDPYFLKNLIDHLESKNLEVLCRVHHKLKHTKYFQYFKKLISWEDIPKKFSQDIFSLPSELILLLIRTSVDHYYLTKNLPDQNKYYARYTLARFLKKRYIFEQFYGEFCPTCLEFNIKKHLPGFDFHHLGNRQFNENPNVKGNIKDAGELFTRSFKSSEIAEILEYENGGFICKNCHNVLGYSLSRLRLLENIYEDKTLARDVKDDYEIVKERFKPFNNLNSIGAPLDCDINITDTYERYLNAIYDLSNHSTDITYKSLAHYFNRHRATVFEILNKDIFKHFIDTEIGTNRLKKFILTDKGKLFIELIQYFREYYINL